MLFENDNTKKKKASNNACWITFCFWGLVLFLNSVFELLFDRELISSSFLILVLGLVIFFASDFIINKKTKY
ncbi:hypothetical protein COD67_06980 [Bacillus cereus]|nr:hypothetical protein COI89_21980 [Bacillus cereus]PGU68323.1 hypothetical protein COD67_06980 [Bacillus cereus]